MADKTEFQMFPTEYGFCETQMCHRKASFYLGRPDCNPGNHRTICKKCADELVKNIINEYGPEEEPEAEEEMDAGEVLEAVNEDKDVEAHGGSIMDLEGMTVASLKNTAKELELTGYSNKDKDELIEMIQAEADRIEAEEEAENNG